MLSYLFVGLTLVTGQADPEVAPPAAGTPSSPRTVYRAQIGTPTEFPPLETGGAPPIHLVQDQKAPPPLGKNGDSGGNGSGNGDKKENGDKKDNADTTTQEEVGGFFLRRFIKAYGDEFLPKKDRLDCKGKNCQSCNQNGGQNGDKNGSDKNGSDKNGSDKNGSDKNAQPEEQEPPRRAMPSPWPSPPFPGSEYQGYPLIGVPESTSVYPFMKAVYGGPWGEEIKESRIKFSGWVTSAGTWSTATNSNTPSSYWIVPNRYVLDQAVVKLERYPDTVQTDHIDWGFRSIGLYGVDYRYTTAGGWGSDQLLKHNLQQAWDPVEQYFNVYIPGFLGGTDIRVGRWIACPDIETQYSVDNYLGSHSLLFTYDTYTQTGIMLTQKINDQWTAQAVLHSGTDMAPWYPGAVPTGAFGIRWVSKDNNDAIYAWLNAINNAEFRRFTQYGQPLGHDNFNYVVATWEHRFNECIHTKTEAYYMWERDAEVGGTPSAGPPKPIGGGGGDGTLIPGLSQAYGVLNYTMFGLTKRDYITVRNEWWKDETGFRAGFAGNYTSHTIGISHQFNDVLMLRPEIGYYRNWNQAAFDLGTKKDLWLYGFDVTLRF